MVLVIYQLFEHFYSSSSSGGSGHQNRSDKITTIKATEIRTRENISKKKIFFARSKMLSFPGYLQKTN